MSIGTILELVLFGAFSLAIVVIVLAVLKNVPPGKKGTRFRTSKKGG